MVDEETDGQTTQQEVRISNFHKSYKHQKYLELVMVFDWSRFMYLGGNFTKIVEDAILLTAIMDTYFQDVRLRICLKGLKVWSSHDRIKTFFPILAEISDQFVLYKRLVLHHVLPADWSHLYLGRSFQDAVAWSWGRACEVYHAGSTSSFVGKNILGPATWSAHEVGHCVGMQHDGKY